MDDAFGDGESEDVKPVRCIDGCDLAAEEGGGAEAVVAGRDIKVHLVAVREGAAIGAVHVNVA